MPWSKKILSIFRVEFPWLSLCISEWIMRHDVLPFYTLLLTLYVSNAVIGALMKGWHYCWAGNDLLLK